MKPGRLSRRPDRVAASVAAAVAFGKAYPVGRHARAQLRAGIRVRTGKARR